MKWTFSDLERERDEREGQLKKIEAELEGERILASLGNPADEITVIHNTLTNIIKILDPNEVCISKLNFRLFFFLQLSMFNYNSRATQAQRELQDVVEKHLEFRANLIHALQLRDEEAQDSHLTGTLMKLQASPSSTSFVPHTPTAGSGCKCRKRCFIGCPCHQSKKSCSPQCKCKKVCDNAYNMSFPTSPSIDLE